MTTNILSAQAHDAWLHSAGVETLRRMADLDGYNRWVFQKFSRYVGHHVLEVGCGIGNMTPYFLRAEHVTCMDVLPESVAEVQQKFADHPNLRSVVADISDPAVLRQIDRNSVDTVVCINVLEHIQHDAAALRHMFEALKPGGHLLLYVPAGQYLFGHLDQALGHFRRYSLETLRDLAQAQGFEAIEIAYMNVAAIPGWFLSSRVLRREAPPRSLLWLFNLLTPALVLVEGILRPPFGQSLVLIGRRP